jgi:hypothetical protein
MQNDGTSAWRGTTFELINNVFYNCMQDAYETFDYGNTCPLNLVANYYKIGPSAAYPSSNPAPHCGTLPPCMYVHAKYNYHSQYPALKVPAAFFKPTTVLGFVDTIIAPRMTAVIDSVQAAYQEVTATSGPLPHDAADTRVLNEARTGTGAWQDSCEPHPDPYSPGTGLRITDTDRDGMPDAWETAHGLNPGNASDRTTSMNGGYNAVEVYLNELADSLINAEAAASGVARMPAVAGRDVSLISASPNPFNLQVAILLSGGLEKGASLKVLDLSGKIAADLTGAARDGRATWNGRGLAAGVYLLAAQKGNFIETRRVILAR